MSKAVFPAIAFDLDGTLTLTLDLKVRNAAKLWHGIYSVSEEAVEKSYRAHSGIPRRELFNCIANDVLSRSLFQGEYEGLSRDFTSWNVRALRNHPFVPGAEKLLRDLKRQGVVLAISSSAEPKEVEARIIGTRYESFFSAIMGSTLGFDKGEAHLKNLAQIANVPVSRILMVGDEPNDHRLARAAGARTALVAQTYSVEYLVAFGSDILAPTLADLRPYVLN